MNYSKLTPEEIRGIAIARGCKVTDLVPFIPCEDRNDEASACREGLAVREVRAVMGVVTRRPAKHRQATSGCGANGRKFHGRLSLQPVVEANAIVRLPEVPVTGLNKKGKPYAGTVVVHGLMSAAEVKRAVAKREKMLQKIIDGK